jgi:hypothetical protein
MKRFFATALCVLTLSTASLSALENRHVRIINRSYVAIRSFYASNVDSGNWEEDILGLTTLSPNTYVDVNIDDRTGHCYYDLRAVMADGRVAETRNFNVCSNSTWTVHD